MLTPKIRFVLWVDVCISILWAKFAHRILDLSFGQTLIGSLLIGLSFAGLLYYMIYREDLSED